jgi:hypothetical protein
VLALLGGSPTSHVHEISYVDPRTQKVTMMSTNLSWSNILTVRETVTYTGAPAAPDRTHFQQEAKVTALCGGWQKIRTKIEEATVERFGENARRGREGFESVLAMSRRGWGDERERESARQAST